MEASTLSNKLENEFNKIFISIRRLKRIKHSSNTYIANRDIDVFYEGMFLKVVTTFEAFVEELFVGLLYNKYSLPTRKKVQKVIFNNKKTVINYLLFNNRFLNLLPYHKLSDNHRVFYNEDNPFNTLTVHQKEILTDIFIIRNAMAHNSLTANKKFKNFIARKHPLLTSIDNPSIFLQSLNNPNQTMFDVYVIELNSIGNAFCNFS